MARVPEPGLHPGAHLEDLAVLPGLDQLQGGLSVGQGVQGFHVGPAGPAALLVLPLGVALLDVGRVPEHDGHELGGEAGGVDGPGEPLFGQQGNAARVVDVGVGDQHRVDIARGEVQGVVVVLVPALLQSAVDEELLPPHLQAVAAAGNRVGGAEKGQLHGFDLLSRGFSTLYPISPEISTPFSCAAGKRGIPGTGRPIRWKRRKGEASMAYELDRDRPELEHRVLLEGREELVISGVEEVESFDESAILLTTAQGGLEIQGEGLHIEKLSLDGGDLKVEGRVNALIYEAEGGRRGGLLARLLGGG